MSDGPDFGEWFPIATARRNGTPMIGAWDYLGEPVQMLIVACVDGQWCVPHPNGTADTDVMEPSHWMPQPTPPPARKPS